MAESFRYVVLRHEGYGQPHYDLMFETSPGSDLLTWRSPNWPLEDGSTLTALNEHRRAYLTFEGPLSGGRGHVRRIHGGNYELSLNSPEKFAGRLVGDLTFFFEKEGMTNWRCRIRPAGQ